MVSISDITAAVKTALESEQLFRKVGDLPEWLKQSLEDQVVAVPAAYVYFEEASYEPVGVGGKFRRKVLVSMIVVTRAYSIDHAKLLHSDKEGTRKGAYYLIEEVVDVLKGNTLSLDIAPLVPVRISALASSQSTAVYNIVFETYSRV
mgnify:FL=1